MSRWFLLTALALTQCGLQVQIDAPDDAAADAATVDAALADAPDAAPDATADAAPEVAAPTPTACLAATPQTLQFAPVPLGFVPEKLPVTLRNTGKAELCVTGAAWHILAGPPSVFAIDWTPLLAHCPAMDAKTGPTPASPCCFAAAAQGTLSLTYQPAATAASFNLDKANLSFLSNSACGAAKVAVSGLGLPDSCPLTQFAIAEGSEVVPWTTLHLSGWGSMGTKGNGIQSFNWSVTRPNGLSETFATGNAAVTTTFIPDTVGAYTICLSVIDFNGVSSCQSVCQTVIALPAEPIYVELTWTTPGDPVATDFGPGAGSDLDLHFAHFLASGADLDCDGVGDPWFSNPFDCYFFNNAPKWGSNNPAILDDPKYDVDDTDGWGPEFASLQQPEGDGAILRFYSIGVHYWSDHGFGPSIATVNLYMSGAISMQATSVLNPADMWYVGKVNWPNSQEGASLPPVTICQQTVGSTTSDVCQGSAKKWLAKGDACIAPCYPTTQFDNVSAAKAPAKCAP